MFASVSCFLIFGILIPLIVANKKVINVYGISNIQTSHDGSTVAAQKLAFDYINNNETNLLPNYIVNLTVLDALEDPSVALQHVLDLMNSLIYETDPNSTSTEIILPIVLGCPYSSLSSVTAPALDTVNWKQISSSATSISLSEKSRYPAFYRTISADSLQAAGIIGLLEHFGWNKFAILYVNDVWGIYSTIEIMKLASIHPDQMFEVSPIAYTVGDVEGIQSAVALLKLSRKFIFVFLVHHL